MASWLKTKVDKDTRDRFLHTILSSPPNGLTKDQWAVKFSRLWDFWARPDQWPPAGNWRTWLILSGRGAGKTRCGAEWVHQMALAHPGCRIALVAETAADARDVMVQGTSGLMACMKSEWPCVYNPSLRRVAWKNGTIATTYSGDEPDQLRGPNSAFAWVDELAKFRYAQETWDTLQMGLRIGALPQAMVTTTPRPLPLLKSIMARASTHVTRVSTYANRANLPDSFFQSLEEQYAGTRIAAQELYGEIVEDVVGALWTWETIHTHRVADTPDLEKIAVGVDPPGSKEGAEAGIVVVGVADRHAYVLADRSLKATPAQWARAAIEAYDQYDADVIVVERNFGGDMTTNTLCAAAQDMWQRGERASADIYVRDVTATTNKVARALPLSSVYEQGRCHHLGEFAQLEEEMRNFTTSWNRARDPSPNRLDALVYAARHVLDATPSSRPMVFGTVGGISLN